MNRNLRIAVPVLILVALAGWAGYQYFIVADAPDEVSTNAALAQLTEDLADEESSDETADAAIDEQSDAGQAAEPVADEQSGNATTDVTDQSATDESTSGQSTTDAVSAESVTETWTVDDDFGDFAFESASGSFAGFRVQKELFVGGEQTAVGRSGGVTGSLVIDDGSLTEGQITVDTTAMRSDIGARENAIADALRSGEFPVATFVITDAVALDSATLDAGETVRADVAGELTIAGVTTTATVSVEATIVEPGLGLIVGTADLVWSDFNIATPNSSAGTVADQGSLEFQLIVRNATA